MISQKPDAVVVIGDISANGDLTAIRKFLSDLQELPGQKLVIRGNSDLRTNAAEVQKLLSAYEQITIGTYTLIAADLGTENAPDLTWPEGSKKLLLFTHHDFSRKIAFPDDLMLYVFGHIHRDSRQQIGNTQVYSVNGCDPDKTIGAPPQVTYFEVDGTQVQVSRNPWPLAGFGTWSKKEKDEFLPYLGISCYDPVKSVAFAVENEIWNIELRPNAVDYASGAMVRHLQAWRGRGGRYLSLHMPDIGCAAGKLQGDKEWEKAILLAKKIEADGLTVHVPKVSVAEMKSGAKETIGTFLATQFRSLPPNIKIGIENMHMTDGEAADERRRFGYLPEECMEWAAYLEKLSGREVQLHLDVGHARNNRPFSEKYTLGVWYEMLGQSINAYHIHQIANNDGVFSNHQPIGGIYEELIAYGSFIESWKANRIAHRPMFVEVKDPIQARRSMEVFRKAAR